MSINDQFGAVPQTGPAGHHGGRLADMNPASPERFGSSAPTSLTLADGLFRRPERWGWEYVEPAPISRYPYADQYPQWQEPVPPDHDELLARSGQAKAKLPKLLRWAGGLTLLGLAMLYLLGVTGFGVVVLLAGLSIGGTALYRVSSPLRRIDAERNARWQELLMYQAKWDDAIAHHDAAEHWRVQTTPLLFPFGPSGQSSRVDVFGGTSAGWASLLATMGSSVLAGGSSLLVLDLSGQNVVAALAELTNEVGLPVSAASAPVDLERTGLLGDLAPEDLAEVLAEAMDSMRGKTDQVDLQAMDAELIHTVARRLEHPRTFGRLAAGVQVLRSTYDPDDDGPLSLAEVQKLTDQVDLIDKSERVRDELRFVGNQLELLTKEQSGRGDAESDDFVQLWPENGLSVIRTTGRNERGKKFVDRVLFQAVAHHIANSPMRVQDPVLVVVGADELGRSSLEAMVGSAWGAQVRLVYIFKHLREDSADLLGGEDSAALMMKIGNGREAATAAEYIGKGFTFQLSQLTRQLGQTVTVGNNTAVTETYGGSETATHGGSNTTTKSRSDTRSVGRGLSKGPGSRSKSSNSSRSFGKSLSRSLSDTWSRSLSDTWSNSRTQGDNRSEAESVNDGQTYQRSYEFTVEPAQIQHLEQTAFVLVHSGPEGRKVTMGDCLPGIAVIDRVSPTPRSTQRTRD